MFGGCHMMWHVLNRYRYNLGEIWYLEGYIWIRVEKEIGTELETYPPHPSSTFLFVHKLLGDHSLPPIVLDHFWRNSSHFVRHNYHGIIQHILEWMEYWYTCFQIFILWSYYICCTTSGGFAPLDWTPNVPENYLRQAIDMKKEHIRQHYHLKIRYCHKCSSFKPNR